MGRIGAYGWAVIMELKDTDRGQAVERQVFSA